MYDMGLYIREEKKMIEHKKDADGDEMLEVVADGISIQAVKCLGVWSVNFAPVYAPEDYWCMTGRGAIATMRIVVPAATALIQVIGDEPWVINCDERRARLYRRYLPILLWDRVRSGK